VSAVPAPRPSVLASEVAEFATQLRWSDLPEAVRTHLVWLMLDHAAVTVAGRPAPAAAIAADHAREAHGGDAATALLDGRRLSAPGAAWSNGVLANVLDYDDGHRITKGHPGAMVIPAALAAAEATGADLRSMMEAVAVGYEIAIRAGVRLHERESQYHASGAWGALGAAAAAGRLLGLDGARLEHAIGLAEYHAPIALIMRSVADPAMTKDATGWGALLGVTSAMLAGRGYTALASTFLTDGPGMELGARWDLLETYVKPYPCCRWTQPGIAAAVGLLRGGRIDDIDRVTIHTFEAAAQLSERQPRSSEDMQYSLIWPVAVALVEGDFGVDGVLADFSNADVAAVAGRTEVRVDGSMTAAFPARRVTRVVVRLRSGEELDSGVVEAPGEPGDPGWYAVIETKARRYLDPDAARPAVRVTDPPAATLAGRDAQQLTALLTYGLGGPDE
jgi:2-methylcitrate dehydratase PrpD